MFMKTAKIILSFTSHTDASLENKSEYIHASMYNNPNFPTPTPSLELLTSTTKAFSDSLIAAAEGGRTNIAVKNKNRKALEVLLRQLGGYVIMIAGEDKAILTSSGFDLHKEAEPSPEVTTPMIEVTAGVNEGEVVVNVTRVKGAKSYSYECTPDPVSENSTWQHEPDSRITHVIKGLPSGKRYAFRTAAVGLRGARAYSSIVFLYVQ